MTAENEAPEPTPEVWVYAGQRQGSNGKTQYEFRDGEDRPLWYSVKSITATVIGGKYRLNVLRRPDAVSAFFGTLSYEGEKIDDVDQIAAWEAEDRKTRRYAGEKAAERKHARTSELDAAIEPLLRIARKARDRNEAYWLAKHVGERIVEAWWTK